DRRGLRAGPGGIHTKRAQRAADTRDEEVTTLHLERRRSALNFLTKAAWFAVCKPRSSVANSLRPFSANRAFESIHNPGKVRTRMMPSARGLSSLSAFVSNHQILFSRTVTTR